MNVSIVEFPGSHGVYDTKNACERIAGLEVSVIWHKEESLDKAEVIILPGGYSFGDNLRPGALAKTSPISPAIKKAARAGKAILGIGNGFQILCELEILPGALMRNKASGLLNTTTQVKVENTNTFLTKNLAEDSILSASLACYYGSYYADKRTLQDLEEQNKIVFRYCDVDGETDHNEPFNASTRGIAGVVNENAIGMMFHPERLESNLSIFGVWM